MSSTRPGTLRHNLVFTVLMLAVAGLGARLWFLRLQYHQEAGRLAQRQQRREIVVPARPGNIYARTRGRYVLLASSRQAPACFADPSLLSDYDLAEVSARVGDVLGVDPLLIQDKLVARRRRKYVSLKDHPHREITRRQADAIRAMGIRAVAVEYQWVRDYPCGDLASTVLGFRLRDGRAGGGLELSLNSHLAAADGKRVVLVDASRRPIGAVLDDSTPPTDGKHVFLCLDAVIQGYLQQAVAAAVSRHGCQKTWGTGVVVDPRTGRVLAMCSVPSFDPNTYNRRGVSRTNRAISVPFEPGSAAKPLFAAKAVNERLVTYGTKIFCENGSYRARRGGVITDHGKSYGYLTVEDGVVLSSNILLAKLGEKLGNRRLYEAIRSYGLGRKTGIPLPGESKGIIRPLARWDGYSLRRIPFGQEMAVTSLQFAMAFCSLANGGWLLKPRLIDQVVDACGKVVYRGRIEVVRRTLRPEVARQTLAVLRQVVERGTGKKCRLDRWTSFGKTGTAQIPGPGGYVDGAYVGSFVGGAPATEPRLLCLISIYWPDPAKGYYGSKVAAPFVKQVLQRSLAYLRVPSDKSIYLAAAGTAH